MAVLLLAEVTNGELNRDATAKAVHAVTALATVSLTRWKASISGGFYTGR